MIAFGVTVSFTQGLPLVDDGVGVIVTVGVMDGVIVTEGVTELVTDGVTLGVVFDVCDGVGVIDIDGVTVGVTLGVVFDV